MSNVWAVSDLHVGHDANQQLVRRFHPRDPADWLIVAGDVSESMGQICDTLTLLRERWARVVWVPGNHELWTPPRDPVQLRGVARYEHLVSLCRELGVDTPEDDPPIWWGPAGPVALVGLFVLYDYSFRPAGTTRQQGLDQAYASGVVCNDEFLLHPDPYPSRQAWCQARLATSVSRLERIDPEVRTVLINHYPLNGHPLRSLYHQEFAQWCGTTQTEDWHRRYRATDVVYGHLHIPRTTEQDGVRFHEVSIGYPREQNHRAFPLTPRLILEGAR